MTNKTLFIVTSVSCLLSFLYHQVFFPSIYSIFITGIEASYNFYKYKPFKEGFLDIEGL